MNKSAIKSFAVNARIKLMDQITQKAFELGISTDNILEPELFADGFRVNGKVFKKYEIKQRQELVKLVQQKGLPQVIEEVAYTWFNRLIAIRFMEVNEYLPIGIRVLSSTDQGKTEPDVVREVVQVELGLTEDDLAVVYRLQDEHNTEELFKYILVKQCNKLGDIMPVLFEQIADYTELLLPDNLLGEGSVIRDLVTTIAEEDWQEQVEIIGWLYQYYISQKKDEVFAELKKNKKITKENIPAATQLFTPDWIVKYMVENSIGRQWLESHPDAELQSKWKYHLEQAKQEPEVIEQLADLKNPNLTPEEIKVLDPCMGSGHILVYAFDVLYDIYKSAGYPERDIPKLIIEKNLYGLDIDDRAAQLAYFAVMMKARSYNRRLFQGQLAHNLCGIQESNGIPKDEVLDIFARLADGELWSAKQRTDVEYLIDVFYDAKEYGSIIEVQPVDFDGIEQAVDGICNNKIVLDVFSAPHREIILQVMPVLIQQGRMLSQKYDVVCTNPPYMGGKGMNDKLCKFVAKNFPKTKGDLFAVFIEKSLLLTSRNGFTSMVTMHSWMFLSSYEKFRETLLDHYSIDSILHLGMEAFESIIGKVVQTAAFVIRNIHIPEIKPVSIRLVDYYDSRKYEKESQFFNCSNKYMSAKQTDFRNIPGSPIAYSANSKLLSILKNKKRLESIVDITGSQHITANNEKYIRYIWEIEKSELGNNWITYSKGGAFRRWWGNLELVVDWSKEAKKFYKINPTSNMLNEKYWFRQGIAWTATTNSNFSARVLPGTGVFDKKGPALFINDANEFNFYLGLLNSNAINYILKISKDGIDYQNIEIKRLPLVNFEDMDNVAGLVEENITISKNDWNTFETSHQFEKHPLLNCRNENTECKIKYAFDKWQAFTKMQFKVIKSNEEELNRIFIDIYGLQDELTSEVADKDVTIRKADRVRDIKSFLSYAVGCMFGRYSLDEPGLIHAGGEFNASRYTTFTANLDNILPLTDDEYFEDDIISRFTDFLSVTFGSETLEENLDYIAETLKRKNNETSRQAIRRYFLKDFYKDHVQTYQKRPIYWLFDSGKNDGFKALIYMHRYDLSTVAKVRTDYLHILQRKYEAEMNRLDMTMDAAISPTENAAAKKKHEKLQKQLSECYQYDQVIAHVANQRISLDLDDGVKVNYAKFQEIQIPQGDGKKPLKAHLLATI